MLEVIRKRVELKRAKVELENLKTKRDAIEEKVKSLRVELDGTEDLEKIKTLGEDLEAILDVEPEELINSIDKLKSKVTELEEEIETLEKKIDVGEDTTTENATNTARGEIITDFETRGRTNYYDIGEVREFYDKVKRGNITGSGHLIPQSVVNKINTKVYLKSKFYRYVSVIKVKGETKVVFSNDKTKADWIKPGQIIQSAVAGIISTLTLDSYKLAKLTNVPNELLDDSIINLDEFITDKFSSAIAVALDEAIIKGTGVDEPTGIITALNVDNKIAIDNTIETLLQTISNISLNDDAEGNLKIIVNRKTFYSKLIQHTIQTNSSGELVAQNLKVNKPMLLDMEIVLSNTVADNQLLVGELKEYTLGDRESTTIAKSTDAGFDTDSTYFRATARYDGKLANSKAFVMLTLNDTPIVKKKSLIG